MPTWMLPAETFQNRTILVTGGGTGLGRAMAACLASLGARVVICGRRADVLERAATELSAETQGVVCPQRCDVRDPAAVEALLAEIERQFGTPHAVVNNAAGNFLCPTERLTPNGFNAVVDIVLRGTFYVTQALGRRWIAAQSGGTVLNIVTTYAWTGSAFVVPSAVAKAGVLALTRSLAVEWGKHKIRLNAIAPGPFPTEGAWSRLVPAELAGRFDMAANVPLARVGEHAELANLAAYLLSDYSAYINGDCITIDGGQWLRGAGQFNDLTALSTADWDALQARMRPAKRES